VISELRAGDPVELGPFRLCGRLGSGGMGQVFLGRDASDRLVAVKVIHDAHVAVPEFRARFAREVRIAAQVRAPWTVKLLDADPKARRPWMATEYVAGPSLEQAVRDAEPLPEASVGVLASRLADALSALHACGVVHRDLKPANVMLAEDGPWLLDFGIARAVDSTRITRTGMAVGTPAFMSPEQAQGEDGGPATDVFSLASVLTFAVTGRGPFGQTGNPVAMLLRVTQDEPDLDGVPGALRTELESCLNKDPSRRPGIRELASTLAHWSTPPASSGWPPPAVSRFTAPLPDVGRVAPPTTKSVARPPAGRDVLAGLTPTSTALRSVSGLFRRGRRPGAATLALLGLSVTALVLLGVVLLGPWSGGNGGPAPGAGTSPTPAAALRPLQLGVPVPIVILGPGSMDISPDSSLLFVDAVSAIEVFDAHTHRMLRTLGSPVASGVLHLSPDGRLLYVVENNQIEIFDLSIGQVTGTIPLTRQDFGARSAMSADGQHIIIEHPISNPPVLTVVDTASRTERSNIPLTGHNAVGDLVLTADGTHAYVAALAPTDPLLWVDLNTGQLTPVAATPGAGRLAPSSDGHELYAQSYAGLLSTIDANTGRSIRKVTMPPTTGVMLAAPGGQIIATDSDTQTLRIVDPASGKVLGTGQTRPRIIDSGILSPDGHQLYLSDDTNSIEEIDVTAR